MALSRTRDGGFPTVGHHLNMVSVADDGEVIVFIDGEIDLATVPILWDRLAKEIPEVQKRLVLDLHEVPFVDSTGLGVLVRAFNRIRHADADLVLRHPTARVRKVLNVSGLDRVFTIQGPPD